VIAWPEACPPPGVGVAAGADDETGVVGVGVLPDGVAAGDELGAVLPLGWVDGVLLPCGTAGR
jgi:hypothetical protein